LNKG